MFFCVFCLLWFWSGLVGGVWIDGGLVGCGVGHAMSWMMILSSMYFKGVHVLRQVGGGLV